MLLVVIFPRGNLVPHIRIAAPDALSALSIAERLNPSIAHVGGSGGDGHDVEATIAGSRSELVRLLRTVEAWLDDYSIRETTIWIDDRPYSIAEPNQARLRWAGVDQLDGILAAG